MRKGFTLIELLIVVVIIGILAVAFVPSMLDAPLKANDKTRVKDLQEIATWISVEKVVPTANKCFNETNFTTFKKADFKGRLPIDPRGAVRLVYTFGIVSAVTCDEGEYLVKVNPSGIGGATSGTYRYALVAKMETKEGSNTSCSNAGKGIIDTGNITTDSATWCYVVLIK